MALSTHPGVAQECKFWGTASCRNQGAPSFYSCLGLLTPRACLSLSPHHPACLLPSVPLQGLHPGSDSFPGGRDETALQGHASPSPNGAAPGPQDREAWRLGPCLSHAASVSWCTGPAKRSSNTAERPTREPVRIPCLSKGLAVTPGARDRTWSTSQRSRARSGSGRNLGGSQRAAAERRRGRRPGWQGQALRKAR